MIRGIVTGHEARIILQIRGRDKRFHAIKAIVDTGFDGWVSLPPMLVANLDLRWKGEGSGILADGSESRFDVCDAAVQWHGRARRVPVYAIGAMLLIGMAALERQ